MNENVIVVSSTPFDTRVALVEHGRLAEMYIDNEDERPLVGNIYKGVVSRVLPGMEAAFLDIGDERAAFLHVSDIQADDEDLDTDEDDGSESDDELEPEPHRRGNGHGRRDDRHRRDERPKSIADLLKQGQHLIVQVTKAPIGTKGARVTGAISLPGRHLVLVPGDALVGVSRKIRSYKERQRLKRLVRKHRPDGCGVIIRTAAESKTREEILGDLEYLSRVWSSVRRKLDGHSAPTTIYRDLSMSLRVLRESFSPKTERIFVDDEEEYERIVRFVESVASNRRGDIELVRGERPIFEQFGVERQMREALADKVWLPSGAYLIIEETEALATVDVNTGRFVGAASGDLEETVLATNLEAADEIARQLRLRNIGGIIVLDFIDMQKSDNRRKVHDALRNALRDDRARTHIQHISELGLIEMTRQRLRMSLQRSLSDLCPACHGKGLVHSRMAVTASLYRELRALLSNHEGRHVRIICHRELAEKLWETGASWIDKLQRGDSRVTIHAVETLEIDQFKLELV